MGRELTATSPEPFSNSSDSVIESGTTANRTRSIFGAASSSADCARSPHPDRSAGSQSETVPCRWDARQNSRPLPSGTMPMAPVERLVSRKLSAMFQMKDHRLRVLRLHRIYRRVGSGLRRNHRAVPHGVDGPHHIARRERAAVCEIAHRCADEKPASADRAAPSSAPAPG